MGYTRAKIPQLFYQTHTHNPISNVDIAASFEFKSQLLTTFRKLIN